MLIVAFGSDFGLLERQGSDPVRFGRWGSWLLDMGIGLLLVLCGDQKEQPGASD